MVYFRTRVKGVFVEWDHLQEYWPPHQGALQAAILYSGVRVVIGTKFGPDLTLKVKQMLGRSTRNHESRYTVVGDLDGRPARVEFVYASDRHSLSGRGQSARITYLDEEEQQEERGATVLR